MSKNSTIVVLAFLFSVSLMLLTSGTASAQAVAGSKHDLTIAGPGIDLGFVSSCFACHTPHPKGAVSSTYGFLWNRPDLAGPFTMYDSTNLTAGNQVGGADREASPQEQDLLCLSCHDGTLNLGASGGATGGAAPIVSTASVTTDLSDDHPIGLDYSTAETGKTGQFVPIATITGGTGVKLFSDGTSDVMVRCASCHNPHDPDGPGGTSTKFLRADADAICQECHVK